LGAVAALINTELRGEPLAHALRTSQPALISSGSEHAARILEAVSCLEGFVPDKQLVVQRRSSADDPHGLRVMDDELDRCDQAPAPEPKLRNDDVCCYVYTSGTTGLPKAAVIRNQRILGGGFTFGILMHRSSLGDLVYVALPLYHSSALFLGWGAALATGAAIGLRPRFSVSDFWKDVRRFRATSFLYIGEMCRYLLSAPPAMEDQLHNIRAAVGNGMRPELWSEFQRRFAIPVIREFYGATEGNVPLLNTSGRPGMLGKMQRGQFVARCDPITGEAVRGNSGLGEAVETGETGLLLGRITRGLRFDGYVDKAATQKKILTAMRKRGDRYFDTGDLVKLHPGGWLSFVDRVGDTYRWKGENVSTQEVASVLATAPAVAEAIVYGVEVPGCEGRAGMAALSIGDGFDFNGLSEFVRENLPTYQRPLFIRLLRDRMRTTGTFKQRVGSYREEGFDPSATDDGIFVSTNGQYASLDPSAYLEIIEERRVPS
jgi:acyl-CoA synthetase (AMP-forming)/AMP-acid ligase II